MDIILFTLFSGSRVRNTTFPTIILILLRNVLRLLVIVVLPTLPQHFVLSFHKREMTQREDLWSHLLGPSDECCGWNESRILALTSPICRSPSSSHAREMMSPDVTRFPSTSGSTLRQSLPSTIMPRRSQAAKKRTMQVDMSSDDEGMDLGPSQQSNSSDDHRCVFIFHICDTISLLTHIDYNSCSKNTLRVVTASSTWVVRLADDMRLNP